MTFKDYNANKISQIQIQEKISALLFLSEIDTSTMNESDITESFSDWMNKFGLKIHKSKGVIDYIKQFSSVAGRMLLAAIKGDGEKVKKIALELSREDFVDFLLKLDLITLHIISGPVHFIDGLTGWNISANLKHVATTSKEYLKLIYDGIENVKHGVKNLFSRGKQKKLMKRIQHIEQGIQ